ncbi:hypothetical protein [Cognatishimia activa]|uniref:Ankyrin-like protein n=1 Tax=Cognatishimia activa TaxID=1715691 RepID=A0A0P1ITL9_9RHOB|nr:hypothetical protein [Cognatishimia activa]CUI81864.1 ankyrin-like protein [Cognatishimia activa]CUK26917.1 ankyrin-like protein [Cognatishimia activa]
MNIDDLMKRTTDLMMGLSGFDLERQAKLLPECEALKKELVAAAQAHPELAELEQLSEALEMSVRLHAELMENPSLAADIEDRMKQPIEPETAIFEAIDDCDLEAVRAALSDWDINKQIGQYDKTALYAAMSNMLGVSLDVISLLLDHGADPSLGLTHTNVLHGLGFANLNDVDATALSKIVLRCVELGADIEQRSENLEWTPLITAVSEWNPVATEALLLAGADIKARAGDTGKGCFSGAGVFAFANGHAPTMAVLKSYSKAN